MDKISIIMPDNLHDFLYALPAVQAYQVNMVMSIKEFVRDPFFELVVRTEDKFRYLFPCIQVLRECVPSIDETGWYLQERGEYDYFIEFDMDKAMDVALPSHRHITDALGIMVGASADKWPALYPLQLHKKAKELKQELFNNQFCISVYTEGWDHEKFTQLVDREYPQIGIHIYDNQTEDPERLITYVHNFDYFIGKASLTNYVAAALKKPVLEFFDTDDQATLYNNTKAPYYIGGVGSLDPNVAFTMWEDKYRQLGEANAVVSA